MERDAAAVREALRSAPSLPVLYPQLAELSIGAGWNKREPAIWPAPRRNFQPHRWHYRDAQAAFDAAGRLVSTEQAERRNLILVNPIEGNQYATLRTMVVAYQSILPGEMARSHRHSPNALRLVLDAGDGAFTTVDARKIPMHDGDVVLTPSWCWHGHGHDGARPAVWVDYLDVPLVQLLEPMFFEEHPDRTQQPIATAPESPYIFSFAATQSRLAGAASHPQFGRSIELGAPALDTLGLHMMALDADRETASLTTTANNVYTVVQGSGRSTIEGESIAWERGDVIAVPAWRAHQHLAERDAILFRVTDAPVMAKLGLLRTNQA